MHNYVELNQFFLEERERLVRQELECLGIEVDETQPIQPEEAVCGVTGLYKGWRFHRLDSSWKVRTIKPHDWSGISFAAFFELVRCRHLGVTKPNPINTSIPTIRHLEISTAEGMASFMAVVAQMEYDRGDHRGCLICTV